MIDRHWHVGFLFHRIDQIWSRVEGWAKHNAPLTADTLRSLRGELQQAVADIDKALENEPD